MLFASSDWFITLFVFVVIGYSKYFGFDFTTLSWKRLYTLRNKRRKQG